MVDFILTVLAIAAAILMSLSKFEPVVFSACAVFLTISVIYVWDDSKETNLKARTHPMTSTEGMTAIQGLKFVPTVPTLIGYPQSEPFAIKVSKLAVLTFTI